MVDKISPQDQYDLSRAINQSSIQLITSSLQGLGIHPRVSHKLLHIHADPETLQPTSIEWSSAWVEQQVIFRACERERSAVRSFIKSTEGIGEIAAFRGNLFEPFGHAIAMKGGHFTVMDLQTREESSIVLPCRSEKLEIFSSLAEIRPADDASYWRPKSKSLAAIDALVQPNILLQMTLANKHDIVAEGLLQALDVLRDPDSARLYFLVLAENFDSFQKQRLKKIKGLSNADLQRLKAVQQFALKVEL